MQLAVEREWHSLSSALWHSKHVGSVPSLLLSTPRLLDDLMSHTGTDETRSYYNSYSASTFGMKPWKIPPSQKPFWTYHS